MQTRAHKPRLSAHVLRRALPPGEELFVVGPLRDLKWVDQDDTHSRCSSRRPSTAAIFPAPSRAKREDVSTRRSAEPTSALGGGAAVAAVIPEGGPSRTSWPSRPRAISLRWSASTGSRCPRCPPTLCTRAGRFRPATRSTSSTTSSTRHGGRHGGCGSRDGRRRDVRDDARALEGPAEETQARASHLGTGDVSNGQPVPYGRWTLAVEVAGEIRDEATVTLERAC